MKRLVVIYWVRRLARIQTAGVCILQYFDDDRGFCRRARTTSMNCIAGTFLLVPVSRHHTEFADSFRKSPNSQQPLQSWHTISRLSLPQRMCSLQYLFPNTHATSKLSF
ncbi:hypothetical protein BDV95DRAFT_58161 [Massariosphaeria phaeospora]|uniref:Uncharacterized protein n=1 Tax=Massariosphaeria phaeospora TaxID=100035 RepID=A0A7C8M5M9_9PLEO|nr:hypothetical protein BDV95DRAFT_58161 [Massariosphaeria phaeospora]